MGPCTLSTNVLRLLVAACVAITYAASSARAESSSSTGDSGSSSSGGDLSSSSSAGVGVRDSSVQLMYQWEYIVASYIIACAGSAAALQVMRQRTGLRGTRNWLLLLGGSVALGVVGIWCMHFIGMMSVMIKSADGEELRMAFEPGLTVVSLIVAVVIVGVGFALAGDPSSVRVWRTCLVGVVGGCGVAVMHYVGMISMVSRASITYDPGVVVASVVVGCVACIAALLIFFHLQHIWHKDWRLQAVIPLIMGVAVCGMHYSGMAAASWHDSFDEPNFDGFATQDELLATVLTLAGVTSAALLTFSLWRMHRLRQIEAAKSSCLTLAALVRDSEGRVLCTLAQTLPSVVIRATVAGEPVGLHALSADFLRMLKISFAWPSVARYQRHLLKLHVDNSDQVSAGSLRLFDQFVDAAKQLAAQLHLPLEHMGFLHWAPTGNMLTLCVRNNATTRLALQQGRSGLRFADPLQLQATLSEWQLPPNVHALEWLDDLADYQRRVLLPLCGDARDEQLEQFLREVCVELLSGKDVDADEEVRAWRQTLGRFVNTKHHLGTLVRHTNQWVEVGLDPMVKAQIEHHLEMEATQTQTATSTTDTQQQQIPPAQAHAEDATATTTAEGGAANQLLDLMPRGGRGGLSLAPLRSSSSPSASAAPTSLFLGLLHVQASPSSGLQVLLPRTGSLSMIPLVKLAGTHTLSAASGAASGQRELEWLREQLYKAEMKSRVRSVSRKRRKQEHAAAQEPHRVAAIIAATVAKAPPALPSPLPSLPGAVMPPHTSSAPPSRSPTRSVPPPLVTSPGGGDGDASGGITTHKYVPPRRVSSAGRVPHRGGGGGRHTDPHSDPSQSPPPPRSRRSQLLPTSEPLLSLLGDFVRARGELSKLVGGIHHDLTSAQLWTEGLVTLNSETRIIVFMHCGMGRGMPPPYSDEVVQLVPLSVFDIVHAAQHPSRTAHQWTRKLLAVAMKNARKNGAAGTGGMGGGGGAGGVGSPTGNPAHFISPLPGASNDDAGVLSFLGDKSSGSDPLFDEPGDSMLQARMSDLDDAAERDGLVSPGSAHGTPVASTCNAVHEFHYRPPSPSKQTQQRTEARGTVTRTHSGIHMQQSQQSPPQPQPQPQPLPHTHSRVASRTSSGNAASVLNSNHILLGDVSSPSLGQARRLTLRQAPPRTSTPNFTPFPTPPASASPSPGFGAFAASQFDLPPVAVEGAASASAAGSESHPLMSPGHGTSDGLRHVDDDDEHDTRHATLMIKIDPSTPQA